MKLQEMLALQGFDLSTDGTWLEVVCTTRKCNRIVCAIYDGEYLSVPADGGEEEWFHCGASSTDIVIDDDDNVLNEQEALKQYFG